MRKIYYLPSDDELSSTKQIRLALYMVDGLIISQAQYCLTNPVMLVGINSVFITCRRGLIGVCGNAGPDRQSRSFRTTNY
jgi:hypothetical protein